MKYPTWSLKFATRFIFIATLISSATAQTLPEGKHEKKSEQEEKTLETIEVSALAISEGPDQIALPYSVMSRDRLMLQGASTLGDVLNTQLGVHSDTFGGGSSRPVIRGQSAPRVRVLTDGASLLDASDISPDHAVTVDPLLGQRIEVLRGPATLLYGGGAIGGVVNVLDNKIPSQMPVDEIDGSVALRANTVAEERAGAAELTFGIGSNLALHAEGSLRDADDYRVPEFHEARVDGTFAESRNASIGLSWIANNGYVGLAYSYRDDNYGLPGHNHEYESCHPDGIALHCDDHGDGVGGSDYAHDQEHGREDPPVVDLKSKRLDARGEFTDPFNGFDRIRFRFSGTDYRHHEVEEEQIATTFRNDGYETRIELQHSPWGEWSGVFGIQHTDARFSTAGDESFLPDVDTRTTGLFLVEHLEANDAWHFELGARHEWLDHQVIDGARTDFDAAATSFSGAAIWQFVPDVSLTFSVARSERLPNAQELYARGVHLATNTYECGLLPDAQTCGGVANDRPIHTETSQNIEIGLRRAEGDFTFNLSAFMNDVDDYTYARTLDQFENFRLIKYTQADVEFRGFEAEITYAFSDAFSATVFGDHVRAQFANGSGNLPRVSPSRLGTRLSSNWGDLGGELEYYHVSRQDRIADFETETPGYDMLNLTVSYTLGVEDQTHLFLRGSNLLDEQVWNHTSFLASVIPLPGRSLAVGVRFDF